jgi:hypothetical protein
MTRPAAVAETAVADGECQELRELAGGEVVVADQHE